MSGKKLLVGLLMVSALAVGCAKKKDIKPDENGGGVGSSDINSPIKEVSKGDIDSSKAGSDDNNAMGLQTIHFPYDSFEIVGENADALKNNVKIMKENSGLAVQIEGHCDERGGIQYNLALGEKRANAVAQQLMAAGIGKSRIATISMGKEKPLVMGSNEEAWAKNRRANFMITAK